MNQFLWRSKKWNAEVILNTAGKYKYQDKFRTMKYKKYKKGSQKILKIAADS